MTDVVRRAVSDDLDTLRRSLTPGHLTPAVTRLLAACAGTLRATTTAASSAETPEGNPS